MSFLHAVPFSLPQLHLLTEWQREGVFGLDLRISTEREEMDEVAELFRAGEAAPRYALVAVSTGEVEIFGRERELGTVPDLATAMAWIAQFEGTPVA